MPHNILLCGKPGCGKTTLVAKVLEKLEGENLGGFITLEMREKSERVGFKIVSLSGEEAILAHKDIESPYRVSKYGVDIEKLEDVGVDALIKATLEADIVVIDEIGKMELCSELFKLSVIKVLESDKMVLATIKEVEDPFVEKIKAMPNTRVLNITEKNRDGLTDKILIALGY